MDFMKYVLCKDTFEGDNSDNYRILTEITFVREVNVDNPDKLPTNFVGTKTLQIPVNYMAEDLTIKQYMITDSFENYESIGNNYYIRTLTLNIVGRNADDGVNWNGTNFGDFTAFQGDVVPGAGNFNSDIKKIGFVFQVVQDTFDDVMIPQEIFHHTLLHDVLNHQLWKIVWHKFHIGMAVFLHELLQYEPEKNEEVL